MKHPFALLAVPLLLSLLACSADDGASAAKPIETVGLNDVSVLFPLPAAGDEADLLGLDATGPLGPLLGPEAIATIEPLRRLASADLAYARWRVVAARIDSCFPGGDATPAPETCQPQLRLVAQPLREGEGPLDHALHLLYAIPASDFADFARAWVGVQTDETRARGTPLSVHPTMLREGLRGPTATRLEKLVTEHAGTANLVKMTFAIGGGTTWFFGAKVPGAGGGFVDETIPSLVAPGGTEQFVQTSDTGAGFFVAGPDSPTLQQLGVLLDVATPAPELQTAFQSALDIENPTRGTSSATTDCVSCHIAGRVKERALFLGASMGSADAFASWRSPELRVSDPTRRTIRQVRAFGYNGREPVLSLRTVNESDVAASMLLPILTP